MFLNNLCARTKFACVSAFLIVFLVSDITSASGSRVHLRRDEGEPCRSNIPPKLGQLLRDGPNWNDAESSCSNGSWSPRSDRNEVTSMFEKLFSCDRYSADQPPTELKDKLLSLGFENVVMQAAPDNNIVAILPGKHWQTVKDKIILIGAHWDTYNGVPVSFTPRIRPSNSE